MDFICSNIISIIAIIIACYAAYFARQSFLHKSYDEKLAKNNILIPADSGKNIPSDILYHLNVNSSLDSAKTILGNPFRMFTNGYSLFNNDSFNTNALLYTFKNCDILIESDDGKVLHMIAVQTSFGECDIEIPPLGVILGKARIGDLSKVCGFDKAEYFRSSKDAYFAMEGYFGNFGYYRYYTFGCYCTNAKKFEDGKLLDFEEADMKVEDMLIDFIAISDSENRGHNIDYRSFR